MIFRLTRPPPPPPSPLRSVMLTMVKRPWPKREAFLLSCGLATKWGEKGPNKLLDNVPLLALDSLSLEQKRKIIQGNKFAKLWARLRKTTPNMGTTCSAPNEAQQPCYQSCFKHECAGVVLSHVQQACFETMKLRTKPWARRSQFACWSRISKQHPQDSISACNTPSPAFIPSYGARSRSCHRRPC